MRKYVAFLGLCTIVLSAPAWSQTYFQKFDPNEDARLATSLTPFFKAVFSGDAKAFAQTVIPGTTIYISDDKVGTNGVNKPLTLAFMKPYVTNCEYMLKEFSDYPNAVEVDWKCPKEPNDRRQYFRFLMLGKVAWVYGGLRPIPIIHVERH